MGTLLGEANSDYYMQSAVPCRKLYYWAITPKHTVLNLYQTGYSYTDKQHRYLRELRLSNFTYLHSLFLSYPYTHNTMQYNQYKQAGYTSAMRYSHARGLTAYSYTIQC